MIRLCNWRQRLRMICHWSSNWGVPKFLGWREIREIRLAEFFGVKYLWGGG